MSRINYNEIPVPSNCPVCSMGVFNNPIKRVAVKYWENQRSRWWCHYCNSFFCWESSDRIVSHIETAFPKGLLGNVDVEAINKSTGVNWIDPKLPDEFDPPNYKHNRNFEV